MLVTEAWCFSAMAARVARRRLEARPAARGVDEALVLHAAPVGDLGGFGLAEPAVGEEAAAERAEGEDGDVVLQRDLRERARGAAVEEGEADLVRGDLDAVLDRHAEVGGVEVGEADLADEALLAQAHEVFEGVEVAGVLVAPPVELHDVHRRQVEAAQRGFDAGADRVEGHVGGRGAPFGEDRGGRLARLAHGAVDHAGHDLGAAVVVGHVEGVEARAGIVQKRLRRRCRGRRASRRAPGRPSARGR